MFARVKGTSESGYMFFQYQEMLHIFDLNLMA